MRKKRSMEAGEIDLLKTAWGLSKLKPLSNHQAPLPSKGLFPHIKEWLATIDKEWDLPKEHQERARKLKKNLLKND